MRFFAIALCLAGSVLASGTARADSEDKLWVAQCIRDNAGSEAPTAALLKYCSCMTNKMDDDENKQVKEWEESHSAEKAACVQRAKMNVPAPTAAPAPAPAPAPASAPTAAPPAPAPAPEPAPAPAPGR